MPGATSETGRECGASALRVERSCTESWLRFFSSRAPSRRSLLLFLRRTQKTQAETNRATMAMGTRMAVRYRPRLSLGEPSSATDGLWIGLEETKGGGEEGVATATLVTIVEGVERKVSTGIGVFAGGA